MLLQLPSISRVPSLLPTTSHGASSGAELVTSDGRSLALVAARLVGEATGGLARLVLEQRFENAYDENLRVTYRMPLPADGAISGYEFVIGERTIKGAIDKKTQKPLQLGEWTLRPYLDVGAELGWITRPAKDVGAVLRDYRNYVHPEKERVHGITLNTHDAAMFWELTKSLCHQLVAS